VTRFNLEKTMSTCPLLRMYLTPPLSASQAKPTTGSPTADTRVKRKGQLWLAVLLSVAGLAGFYQLRQVLNALPDSNDDFIYF
jgi:MprA protease rhombosortase-interaction domain-containing protein